ncbi:hypothetical protein AB0L10_37765 [Streptomyces flaveolus]|uniref:hypothetical protein n=1 Tax=Streptomyces flaveolus TaxID=67297 RepID=UPI003413ECC5
MLVDGVGVFLQPRDLRVQPRPGAGDASGAVVHVALGLDPGDDAPAEAPAVLVLVLEPVDVEEGTQEGQLMVERADDVGAEQSRGRKAVNTSPCWKLRISRPSASLPRSLGATSEPTSSRCLSSRCTNGE